MKSAIEILSTENPGEKTRLTFLAEINWKNECLSLGRADNIPARPKRPIKPTLSSAKNMPRRSRGRPAGKSSSVRGGVGAWIGRATLQEN